jgi:hypothetical protein
MISPSNCTCWAPATGFCNLLILSLSLCQLKCVKVWAKAQDFHCVSGFLREHATRLASKGESGKNESQNWAKTSIFKSQETEKRCNRERPPGAHPWWFHVFPGMKKQHCNSPILGILRECNDWVLRAWSNVLLVKSLTLLNLFHLLWEHAQIRKHWHACLTWLQTSVQPMPTSVNTSFFKNRLIYLCALHNQEDLSPMIPVNDDVMPWLPCDVQSSGGRRK